MLLRNFKCSGVQTQWAYKLYLDCCIEGGIIHIIIASCAIELIVLKVDCKLMTCTHRSRQSDVAS